MAFALLSLLSKRKLPLDVNFLCGLLYLGVFALYVLY